MDPTSNDRPPQLLLVFADPLGKRFRATTYTGPQYEVVGVSADYKVSTIGEGATPYVLLTRASVKDPARSTVSVAPAAEVLPDMATRSKRLIRLRTAIEQSAFPFEHLSDIAELESWRKEVNRPVYHMHKWWATRLGSVFRAILLAGNLDLESANSTISEQFCAGSGPVGSGERQ